MLIAFVLLGRNLEQRAKIKATSDMTGLLSLLPSKARLLVNNGETEVGSIVEVPSDSLSVGDQIIVLPGVSNIKNLHFIGDNPIAPLPFSVSVEASVLFYFRKANF